MCINTVDFIYGNIDGDIGKVGINQNYTNGTKMIVHVYDTDGNILATSDEFTYEGANIDFDPITF